MPNNIKGINVLSGALYINPVLASSLREAHERELPELNFLDETPGTGDLTEIRRLWWSGEGSARSFELFKHCLASTVGTAQLAVVWESGDMSGLHVADGTVTPKRVRITLE